MSQTTSRRFVLAIVMVLLGANIIDLGKAERTGSWDYPSYFR